MKLFLVIGFLCSLGVCFAQERIYVPDPALRAALQKQGIMQGDTIYTQFGRKQLDIKNAGIRDLTGIRAFSGLWRLDIFGNDITSLDELPPQLTHLYCQNNKIEVLNLDHPKLKVLVAGSNHMHTVERLPNSLQTLDVMNNLLDSLPDLPPTLVSLNISNCHFHRLPALPQNIYLLKYSGNPIDTSLLPDNFKACPCTNMHLNCLPSNLVKWKVFGLQSELLNTNDFNNIESILIKTNTTHSWGYGDESVQVSYARSGNIFETTKTIYQYSGRTSPRERIGEGLQQDSLWFSRQFPAAQLYKVLFNLYSPKLQWNSEDFGYKKSEFAFDLSKLPKSARDGQKRYNTCEDCSYYALDIQFLSSKSIVKTLHLEFDTGFRLPGSNDTAMTDYRIQQMLEWMYLYQLCHLFFPEDLSLNRSHFNENSMVELSIWSKKLFPELNK